MGLPQDLLCERVPAARSTKHGLPVQKAQVPAVQERPVSTALTLESVDPAGRMLPSASSNCMLGLDGRAHQQLCLSTVAGYKKQTLSHKRLESGGTCSAHRESRGPQDANPDLSEPVQTAIGRL